MKFRLTLLMVCLLLLWLGGKDLLVYLRNPSPEAVGVRQLLDSPPRREWLTITGGVLDLKEAISTSGTLELDALLVPVKVSRDDTVVGLLLETRNPTLLKHFQTYHFLLDNAAAQEAYLQAHQEAFSSREPRQGMVITGAVADSNRRKLMELAAETGMSLTPDVVMVSEGKAPSLWGGLFLFTMGLAGLGKLAWRWRPRR